MAMLEENIIKKIPGIVCHNPKEKQGYIQDLNSKSKVELVELLERQDKLLSNKYFIGKLADKGEKIKSFRERVMKTLADKDQIEQTCGLLSGLFLSKSNVVDEIEWTGKLTGVLNENNSGNSSDEEIDTLKILASHAGTGRYKKKKHRRLKEQEHLERIEDGIDSSTLLSVPEEDSNGEKLDDSTDPSFKEDLENNPFNDLYAKHLCDKVDQHEGRKTEAFKPHCTTKSGVHPGLFVPKHQGPHWEVTAATPPPPVHGAAKLLTLQESLQLQQLQAANLKDVQARHAIEKLASGPSVKLGSVLPDFSARNEYRVTQEYDSSNSSDAEEHDGQSDDDKEDTIVYTYTE